MARNSDDLADSFATDESGSWLARFVADEEDLDTRAKWRLASWAAGSLGALVIAILASQTATDRKRDQVAAVDLARQSQQIQRLAKESQSEASRLAAAIDTLNSDRDRLYSRLGTLEQGLESVTGSIARVQASAKPTSGDKAAATALPAIPVKEPPGPQIAAVDSKSSAQAAPSVPPAAAAAQSLPSQSKRANAAAAAETASPSPRIDQPEPPAPVAAAAASPVASPSAVPPSPPAQEADAKRIDKTALAVSPATPLMASRSMLAPPDSAAGKLLEPWASDKPEGEPPADTSEEKPVVVPRTEFGAELGGANSVEGLRSLWRRMSKAHKELKDMQPIITVKENASGGQLRLVVGPLNDAAAAARLCATLGVADRGCEASVFDGQRLPLISTAPPPPQAPRKRPPKVTTAPEPPPPPEPPPAPKPASLSTFLGIR